MQKHKNPHDEAVQAIIDIVSANGLINQTLIIVDITIIKKLLGAMPLADLRKFAANELLNVPNANDKKFGKWMREVRSRTELSQKAFADLLRDKGNVKIHQSDIGNIERGLRLEDYAPDRLNSIRGAILRCVPFTESLNEV